MNRVLAAAAGLATAAVATTVLATAIGPALAATRPAAAHPATRPANAAAAVRADAAAIAPALRHLKAAAAAPVEIASELDHGKYVSVVKCSGGTPPKPIRLSQKDIPLTVHGTGSSPAVIAKLAKPHRYKTLYVCTVTVELQSPATTTVAKKKSVSSKSCKICTRSVTLNTGFGGMAAQVATHHPAK